MGHVYGKIVPAQTPARTTVLWVIVKPRLLGEDKCELTF